MMQGTGESKPFAAAGGGLRIGPEKEKGLLAAARKNLPSPKEMVAHYESQGMQPQEASLKVIDDLQNLLFRVVTTNNKTKKTTNLDAFNSRLLRLESKLDSKPGFPQTLAIGIASGAVFHVLPQLASSVAHIWTSVRASTSS